MGTSAINAECVGLERARMSGEKNKGKDLQWSPVSCKIRGPFFTASIFL